MGSIHAHVHVPTLANARLSSGASGTAFTSCANALAMSAWKTSGTHATAENDCARARGVRACAARVRPSLARARAKMWKRGETERAHNAP